MDSRLQVDREWGGLISNELGAEEFTGQRTLDWHKRFLKHMEEESYPYREHFETPSKIYLPVGNHAWDRAIECTAREDDQGFYCEYNVLQLSLECANFGCH